MIPMPVLRRFCIAAVVMFAAMALIWWAVWSIAASQYRDFINGWIETHRPAGYQVTYADQDIEGFPRLIVLHFSNLVLQNPDGVKIHANDVSLATFPWQWHHFDAKLKHGFELTIPFTGEKTLVISTQETARNHTELQDNGDWQYLNLELADAKALWGSDPFFSAGNFEVAFQRPDTEPKDRTQPGLNFEGLVENMTLPPGLDSPFGADIAKIETAFRVMGPVPDPREKKSVAAWNGGNGVVEFDKFLLNWGPLVLSARGTLGLDDDLQPEGAFSGQIGNHEAVLKTLLAHDYIPQHEAGMLDSALNLFAKKSSVGGTRGIEVPITVQLGGFFLGPVRVFEFPEIEWEPAAQEEAPDQPAAAPPPAAPAPAAPATALPSSTTQ